MYQLTPDNRLALLMHETVGKTNGKMGYGLLRYGAAPVVVIIDKAAAGQSLKALTGIDADVPIVASVTEALAFAPDALVPAIAPTGGVLPPDWAADLREALAAGLSLVNGLHLAFSRDPSYADLVKRPGQFIWDIRQEPAGLMPGAGRARETTARRVLLVGTDMNNGKMTAALELDKAARSRGLRSRFLATGQIGISIAGEGIPLDAVRVDFASGSIEQMVVRHGYDHDILFIEGQGSLLHPASTATLPLLRGSLPTDLILVHRAGQTHISTTPWVAIPSIPDVIALYEAVSAAAGALPGAGVAGIALNTAKLTDDEAQAAITEMQQTTGLPVTDVIRYGPAPLLDGLGITDSRVG